MNCRNVLPNWGANGSNTALKYFGILAGYMGLSERKNKESGHKVTLRISGRFFHVYTTLWYGKYGES